MKTPALPADFVPKNARPGASMLKRKKWIFHAVLHVMIVLKPVLKTELDTDTTLKQKVHAKSAKVKQRARRFDYCL